MHNHPGQSRHHLQWASVHSLIQCLIVACLHHVHHATYPFPSSVLKHESQSTWCGFMESWDEGSHWAHGGVCGTLFMVWHIFGTRTIKQYPMKLKLPQHTGLLITHVVWTNLFIVAKAGWDDMRDGLKATYPHMASGACQATLTDEIRSGWFWRGYTSARPLLGNQLERRRKTGLCKFHTSHPRISQI